MRIGVVNDLRLAVEAVKRALATMPGVTIAWIAENGEQAVARCREDRPDVVLMDMIMPVMDGVEATRRIMKATPCPILVVTATVEGNASKVFEALGAGALDAVATPGIAADGGAVNAEPLVRKIRMIALVAGIGGSTSAQPAAASTAPVHHGVGPLVAIGASTGGPQALAVVLRAISAPAPWPIVIVQHIDTMFASGLADWLARETGHVVRTARDGDLFEPGRVLIADTEDHLIVDSGGRLRYTEQPRELPFRPSVDVFFDSLASTGAAAGVAVILTGMGRDGAQGMGKLKAAGWTAIAQDQATSVVWGMPGAAVEIGAASRVLPIEAIGSAVQASMLMQTIGVRRNS